MTINNALSAVKTFLRSHELDFLKKDSLEFQLKFTVYGINTLTFFDDLAVTNSDIATRSFAFKSLEK